MEDFGLVKDGWNEGYREELEGGGLVRSLGGLAGVWQARSEKHQQLSDVRILGDGDFVGQVLRQAEELEQQKDELSVLSFDSIIGQIAKCSDVAPESIRGRGRDRKISRAKSLIIYAATEWLDRPLKQMADYTKMSLGCASRSRQRGKSLADQLNLSDLVQRQQGNSVP